MNASTRNNLLLLLLLAVTLAVYLPVAHHGFVNYDDDEYVVGNPHVRSGLTWEGIRWAFTTGHACNWQPVTWLSHMTDWQLFGNKPGAHHVVSVGFHLLNVLLLFWVLRLMTGAVWRSLVVAGLFALHPLHVESVAWIAERKDVLSTFFGLLTLWAYTCYVRRPGVWRYALALLFFALGLMSKPMLVTWPFVLLLLDWWPLGRWGGRVSPSLAKTSRPFRPSNLELRKSGTGGPRDSCLSEFPIEHPIPADGRARRIGWLLLEKLPFLLLAVASSVITMLAQQQGGAVMQLTRLPLGMRVGNAMVAYVAYQGKMLWPVNLAVPYPLPPTMSPVPVVMAGTFLLAVTLAVLWRARRQPYLASGWFWYVGTLVPVIGLVQVGSARMADRYTYIPLIGIFVLLAWALADFVKHRRWGRAVAGIAAAAVLAACGVVTARQVGVWKNSVTLFEHTVAAGEASEFAHNNLATALGNQGKWDEAIAHHMEALRLNPNHITSHKNLGVLFTGMGRLDEALAHCREALRLNPDDAELHYNLGNALAKAGEQAGAITHYREALRLKPDYEEVHNNLGAVLAARGQPAEAIAHYREALRLNPANAAAHNNLGVTLAAQGQPAEAILHYQEALRLEPEYEAAHNNLSAALAAQRQPAGMIARYREALRLNPADVGAHNNLGVFLGETGQPAEALVHYREVLRLNPDDVEAHNNMAWLMATCPDAAHRNGAEAVKLAEQACTMTGRDSPLLDTLAAAYAEAGRFAEAVKTAEQALVLAGTDKALAGQIEAHLQRYRQGQPWREIGRE